MRDGATVKKIFDDIFDSTRYSKALDAILKAKKDKSLLAKDLKGEVMEASAHLEAARACRRDLAACIESKETCESDLEQLNEKVNRMDERVGCYNEL